METDNKEKETATEEEVQIEMRARTEFDTKKDEKKHNRLRKCFLVGIGLIILLAGVIVLIVFLEESISDPHGNGFTTEKNQKECEDVAVALGDDIEIICKMRYAIPGDVEAIYANLVGATAEDFTCNHDNKTVSCKARQKATCSIYGNVTIRFYDSIYDDRKVQFTRTVRLKGTYTSPVATIEQMENAHTQFSLHCSYTSCRSYDVGFYGRNNINITDSVSCKTTFSDREGYTVTCSAMISSKAIYEYGNGSVLNCHLKHGDKIEETKELVLPACHDIPFWKEACHADMTTLFTCDKTQNVRESCNKTCVYEILNNTSSSMCPECALKWCREADTLIIDNTGTITFNELCRNGYINIK